MDINNLISEYEKRQLQEAEKAKRREKLQMNINPDSLIGREIKYQTALEHEILQETRQQSSMLKEILKLVKMGVQDREAI